MSLAAQVTNLTNDRNNIRTSLINKGITEAANHGFSSFDEDIDRMVKPEGTYTVTENGEYDVTEWEGLVVDVYTVVPLESPEADADTYQISIVLTWNIIPNAISYTIERKHGADGEWSTIYIVKNESTNEYKDSNIILGDQYYYRVYAISDGTSYGNSLSSNIVSITAPTGGGYIDVYKNNDYCESVSGGWYIESFGTPYIDRIQAPINQDGYLNFTYSDTGYSVWMHTDKSFNLMGNYIDGMNSVTMSIRKYSGNAPDMEFGLFSKNDPSVYYVCYSPPDAITKYTFNIKDEGTSSPGRYSGYTISNIPSGEYYIGVRCQGSYAETTLMADCKIGVVFWDGIMLDHNKGTSGYEIPGVTGGYIGLGTPLVNALNYEPINSVKEVKTISGNLRLFFSKGSSSTSNYCYAFMPKNQINFGGYSNINISWYSSKNNGYRCDINFLDRDYNRIASVGGYDPGSSFGNVKIPIPRFVMSGMYYIEFELYNYSWIGIQDIFLD